MLGAVVIIISFVMDFRNPTAGGMPHPFNWSVLSAGLVIGVGSYAWAERRRGAVGREAPSRREQQPGMPVSVAGVDQVSMV
jgi:hypothetical protein